MKKLLIIIALALFVCLAVIGSRPDEPVVASASDTSRGPIFEVQVVKPRSARPLFGILPARLEAKLLGDEDLRFDNASRGAEICRVGHDRLELKADGWELFIEAYGSRPAYQQNDYIGWITRAKRPETKEKRLHQMLDELRHGDVYMEMDYRPSGDSE